MAMQLKAIKGDITSVEKFEFDVDPIKGFPELRWTGKRPFRSTQYYPAQLKETFGVEVNSWLNEIYWGDNLQVMSHLLKKYRGKFDLIYIDPPFDSKADYKKTISLKGKSISNDSSAFEEKQYSDIWSNDEYLQFMYERMILCRELLSEKGCLFIHLDWRQNSYVRILLDEIFGKNCYKNEIRWRRQPVRGAKATSKQFARNSDTIIFYSKSNDWIWNGSYKPYDEKFIKTKFRPDKTGRLFRDSDLGDYSEDSIKEFDRQGKIYTTSSGKKRLIRYLDEEKGESLGDIWGDISEVNSMASDRLDYPTQKPIELLERIINACSNPDSIVFDCFMGSGTTQAAAMKLGRRFIGADINLGSIQTATKRLLKLASELDKHDSTEPVQLTLAAEDEAIYGTSKKIETFYTGFSVYNVNHYDIFRNPVQAKDLLIEALEVQPYPSGSLWDGEKDGRKIKIMPVNRIATKADLNEIIANIPWKEYEKKHNDAPTKPVDYLTLVCMGHEPDLAGALQMALNNIKIDIQVVDILRDKTNLEFKRDSEAKIEIKKDKLMIKNFYPMNLLQKLSLMKKDVEEWRELVDSVMIDFNYDGGVFTPVLVDVPEGEDMVIGEYEIPKNAGNIKVKITDLLSETFEKVIEYGNQ